MLGNGTTSNAAREETSPQKRPFKSPVAVQTTTAETGNFASSIETVKGLTIGPPDGTRELGLHSSQDFACQDRQPYFGQCTHGRCENAMRPCNRKRLNPGRG